MEQKNLAADHGDHRLLERAIGRAVRGFRDKTGLTIHELSKASGISPGMLSKIEHGSTSPSLSTIHALSRALNVPIATMPAGVGPAGLPVGVQSVGRRGDDRTILRLGK